MLTAFIFSVFGTMIFMKMIKAIKLKNIIFVPLVGMMLGKVIGSITSFISLKYDLVQNITSWMQGDMSLIMKGGYELLYLSIPMVILAFVYANKFTIVGMGEEFAINLGLNYNFVVNVGLAIVALISAILIGSVYGGRGVFCYGFRDRSIFCAPSDYKNVPVPAYNSH